MDQKINHLKEILVAYSGAGVEFVVCGGVALAIHGVERLTVDVDLSVNLADANLRKFIKVTGDLGLTPRAPVPAETILDPLKREEMIREKNALVFTFIDLKSPYRQVDIFLSKDFSYENLIGHTDIIELDGLQVRILSADKLLEQKRMVNPQRDKDIYDISMLSKIIKRRTSDGNKNS